MNLKELSRNCSNTGYQAFIWGLLDHFKPCEKYGQIHPFEVDCTFLHYRTKWFTRNLEVAIANKWINCSGENPHTPRKKSSQKLHSPCTPEIFENETLFLQENPKSSEKIAHVYLLVDLSAKKVLSNYSFLLTTIEKEPQRFGFDKMTYEHQPNLSSITVRKACKEILFPHLNE